ncbi:hypothetical protein [Winogradskyella sp. R77965]|uniref:hypothetical protein n=1 Tax=Winogradskyella sp. R77965 TaxID=3093872 RepID=UPI0037DD403A
MNNKYTISIILLFITFLNSLAQNIPNDTIIKKDGTKIIDNFQTITVYKGHLITSTYELSSERIEKVSEKELKKIAIPINEIDRLISNYKYQKKRKFLNENDIIWNSETNNHKRKVWVLERSETKTVVLPDGKIKFLYPLVEGSCCLYFESFPVIDLNGNIIRIDINYYVQREGEYKSTLLKGGPKEFFSNDLGEFIKTKKISYFDNCPKAKKIIISQKKISKKEIIELVKLYNEHCDGKKSDK